jgi:rubrerythrin
MDGGIRAWNGLLAEGPPEAGIVYFASGADAADMTSLAWALEEGTRQFYGTLSETRQGTGEGAVFRDLGRAEERHKETLAVLNGRLTSEPVERMYRKQVPKVLEGGVGMEEALEWTQGRTIAEVLDFALGLEANAYDRYLKMVDGAGDDDTREVFRTIAREEKEHLKRLADLMDRQFKSRA